jgi:hypothetical protein
LPLRCHGLPNAVCDCRKLTLNIFQLPHNSAKPE